MNLDNTAPGQFQHGPYFLADTLHNRLSAIASDVISSAVRRSDLMTSRSNDMLARFIIEHLNIFTVLSEDPIDDVLQMWMNAGITPTGNEQEFMITLLVEIQSGFSAQSIGYRSVLSDYLQALYPQLGAGIIPETSEAHEAFNLSFVFPSKDPAIIVKELLSSNFSWAVPWMILAHADFFVIQNLIVSIQGIGED